MRMPFAQLAPYRLAMLWTVYCGVMLLIVSLPLNAAPKWPEWADIAFIFFMLPLFIPCSLLGKVLEAIPGINNIKWMEGGDPIGWPTLTTGIVTWMLVGLLLIALEVILSRLCNYVRICRA